MIEAIRQHMFQKSISKFRVFFIFIFFPPSRNVSEESRSATWHQPCRGSTSYMYSKTLLIDYSSGIYKCTEGCWYYCCPFCNLIPGLVFGWRSASFRLKLNTPTNDDSVVAVVFFVSFACLLFPTELWRCLRRTLMHTACCSGRNFAGVRLTALAVAATVWLTEPYTRAPLTTFYAP